MNNDTEKISEEPAAVTVLKGVIGAFLGAVPSAILWTSLGKVGYIGEICGFFMIFGELYICSLMTRKSKEMNAETATVICIAVTAVTVYVCERAVWAWDIYDALAPDGPALAACFLRFEELKENMGLSADFTSELVKSYAFAAMGATTHIVKAIKFDQQ